MNKIILILLLTTQVVFSAELDQSQNNSYSQRESFRLSSLQTSSFQGLDEEEKIIAQHILKTKENNEEVLDFSKFPTKGLLDIEFIQALMLINDLNFKEINLSGVKMNPGVLPTLQEMIEDNGVE